MQSQQDHLRAPKFLHMVPLRYILLYYFLQTVTKYNRYKMLAKQETKIYFPVLPIVTKNQIIISSFKFKYLYYNQQSSDITKFLFKCPK